MLVARILQKITSKENSSLVYTSITYKHNTS